MTVQLLAEERSECSPTCPSCSHPFSDWFTWGEGGFRHCFVCWLKSGYQWTYLETGERKWEPKW